MKLIDVAAVPETDDIVALGLEEAVQHGPRQRVVPVQDVAHALDGGRLQNGGTVVGAVLQVGQHEARHVVCGRADDTGGRLEQVQIGSRYEISAQEPVACGQPRLQVVSHGRSNVGVGHRQRFENVLFDELLPRHAAHALHDVSGERGTVVGVGHIFTGCSHPAWYVRWQIFGQRHDVFDALANTTRTAFFKARCMGHEMRQRNGRGKRLRYREIEVGVHVGIEIEFAALDELHHGGPYERLGDRGDTE